MSVTARVRELLRDRERRAWMDERAAAALLYPPRRHVQAAPVAPPLTDQRPQVCEPDGALGERGEILGVSDSTG